MCRRRHYHQTAPPLTYPRLITMEVSYYVCWFAVLGALGAALHHGLAPMKAIGELTPVAMEGPHKLQPAAAFWGGYAFAAMNLGFFTVGIHALLVGSQEAQAGVLLGTSVLFMGFAAAWLFKGDTVQGPKSQWLKVSAMGVLFFQGYFLMHQRGTPES